MAVLAACAAEEAPFDPQNPDSYDPEPEAPAARTGEVRLRLVAANITSGNSQAYEDPGIRIFKGLVPDVAMIQEFNYKTNSAADLRSFVDQAFGPGFVFSRETGAQIPNGVVSRYPILASGIWADNQVSNRQFEWAQIDIPGSIDLYAISVHLLTASPEKRNAEAQELLGYIQALPAGSYIVLGGDFNTAVRDEPALATLAPVLVTAAPFPVDQLGNSGSNSSRIKGDDWVLPSPNLAVLETPVIYGANSFAHGLVADTRVYTPITDLAPALASDSGAVNMQHMAIVRDFVLNGDAPTSSLTVTAPNGGETWVAGSAHDIAWTSSGVDAVKVEVTLDGTTWSTVSASTPATTGHVAWTAPATATSAGRARVSAVPGGSPSDASDAPFNITVAQSPAKVFINEILANEPGSDVNGEFVELVNNGDASVSLAGYTVSDAKAVRHVFTSGTVLAGHSAIVVYGASAGIPSGVTNAVGASTGTLSLTNGGDSVILTGPQGVVDTVSFTSALALTDGLSMNRKPDGDPAGTFVLHNTLSSKLASPGTRVDGSAFGGGTTPPPPPGNITAEVEPNDSAATASGPVGSAAVSGAIGSTSDADWYRVPVTTAGTLTISVAITGSADLDWYLYKADGTTQVARGYTTQNPESGTAPVVAGTYLLKVQGYQGAKAPYVLQVSGI